tara:strand:- start:334 stop:687 length:354 start_codon:yes stop_codon:yes gene_type:complete
MNKPLTTLFNGLIAGLVMSSTVALADETGQEATSTQEHDKKTEQVLGGEYVPAAEFDLDATDGTVLEINEDSTLQKLLEKGNGNTDPARVNTIRKRMEIRRGRTGAEATETPELTGD